MAERTEVILLDKENGVERKKINIICEPLGNIMAKTHKYFTKDQRKIAKFKHKANGGK